MKPIDPTTKSTIERLASIQIMFYGHLDIKAIANKTKAATQTVELALQGVSRPEPYYKWDRIINLDSDTSGGVLIRPEQCILEKTNNKDVPAKAFRASDQALKVPVNARGLAELNFSAGAQFTSKEFEIILNYVKHHRPSIKQVIVVDLRKEFHFFIDGVPFSIAFAALNVANFWKKETELAGAEKRLKKNILRELARGSIMIHGREKEKPPAEIFDKKQKRIIQTEQELVTGYSTPALAVSYKRFYNLDHARPSNKNVDGFIKFVSEIDPANTWLHFHCKGGKGRTTIYSYMYDLFHNIECIADLEEAYVRQVAMGGKDFRKVLQRGSEQWDDKVSRYGVCGTYYLEQNYLLREKFLGDFFRFAKSGLGKQRWTKWSKANGCGDDSTASLDLVGQCYENNPGRPLVV